MLRGIASPATVALCAPGSGAAPGKTRELGHWSVLEQKKLRSRVAALYRLHTLDQIRKKSHGLVVPIGFHRD
jgi:hypothetical protein